MNYQWMRFCKTSAKVSSGISFIALIYCLINLIPWVNFVFVFSGAWAFVSFMAYTWELHKYENRNN